jgi:hypothetical protein
MTASKTQHSREVLFGKILMMTSAVKRVSGAFKGLVPSDCGSQIS